MVSHFFVSNSIFLLWIFYAKHFSHKLKNLNTFKAINLIKQTLATCAITFNMRWPAHIVCVLYKWPKFNWTHLLLFTVHGKDRLNLVNKKILNNFMREVQLFNSYFIIIILYDILETLPKQGRMITSQNCIITILTLNQQIAIILNHSHF